MKNTISFEQWILENNRKNILDRWDYKLNDCKPSEISYSSNKKTYFKCPRGLHKSELKNINSFTNIKTQGVITCKACNSIAQWGIDNLGEDFLDKYWDYDKNGNINPYDVSYKSHKKIYIKCQNDESHGSRCIESKSFVNGDGCPFCSKRGSKRKTLKKDSLAYNYPEVLNIWSEKNINSPYDYSVKSRLIVWWKNGEEEYKRSIFYSINKNFLPPSKLLKSHKEENDIYIKKRGYPSLEKKIIKILNKFNIEYMVQKEFEELTGIGNRNLSYDFYLKKYNLLIEAQGKQHEKPIEYFGGNKKFRNQQEHDKRKNDYAKNNNINLLEIWYYDYYNVEEIIINKLNINLE
jgi:transcription elongation factor Elf1